MANAGYKQESETLSSQIKILQAELRKQTKLCELKEKAL